ncbi:hypothetical protein EIP86_000160 [Pleurotus ostreatoroseus]|nr:hypothetical protein EIP86_000160 [Pleurotus ostreatoroseus]
MPTSSLLSQALDQKRRAAGREDSVGPFQLGFIPPTPQDTGDRKKWSDLNAGGKVVRATSLTSSLFVIVFGAGFTAMLAYALTSELFSKNSPTVLHAQACELIKSSPRVKQYLHGPLIFHNNPPSVVRPRHRNDRVASQIVRDSAGREHLLLNFFVQGQTPGAAPVSQSESRWEAAVEWTQNTGAQLSEMTLDEVVEGAKRRSEDAWESCKRLFRFLSGDPVPSTRGPAPPAPEPKAEKQESGWRAGLMGMFGGLRGSSRDSGNITDEIPDGQVYTEGEVHADLVMNDQGQYEFRYVRIDIPDSAAPNPKRVFVLPPNGNWEARRR